MAARWVAKHMLHNMLDGFGDLRQHRRGCIAIKIDLRRFRSNLYRCYHNQRLLRASYLASYESIRFSCHCFSFAARASSAMRAFLSSHGSLQSHAFSMPSAEIPPQLPEIDLRWAKKPTDMANTTINMMTNTAIKTPMWTS